MNEMFPPPTIGQQMSLVVLCQGQMADGNAYWAYLNIPMLRVKAFKQAQRAGAFQLEEFGEVMEWGIGSAVPDEVKTRMEREHGVDHNFQNQVIEAARSKQRKRR